MAPFTAGLIIGFFVGGMFGVFVMCLVSANREFDFDDELIRRGGGDDATT